MEFDARTLADEAGVRVYDTALPLAWYEDVHAKTGLWPQRLGFVWSYDDAKIWGEPVPLTSEALDCLYAYHKMEVEAGSGGALGHVALGGAATGAYDCRTCATINAVTARLGEAAALRRRAVSVR